ncbi:MAG: DNA repair protein RadC [Rickettsia sp.]|nr:DNA repair protein RadC [Rickettsia sp.]
MKPNKTEEKHFVGHRKRVKNKFLYSKDLSSFDDYELLEILLFLSIPRKDVKPIAKNLLSKFNSLHNVFNAEKEEITTIKGLNENSFINFQLIKEFLSRILKNNIKKKNIISSWSDLLKYLKFNMSALKIEHFRVIFLNSQKIILCDEIMSKGTVDQTAVYPREILKKTLLLGASSIILVHNHPGGSTKPSKADRLVTSQIQEYCQFFNISLHDHVIISDNQYYSFKENYLL